MKKLSLSLLAIFACATLGTNRAEAQEWTTPQLETETGLRIRIAENVLLLPALKYSSVFGLRGHVLAPSVSLVRKTDQDNWLAFRLGLAFDPAAEDSLATAAGVEKKETVLAGFVEFRAKLELIFFEESRIAYGFHSGDYIHLIPLGKGGDLGHVKLNTGVGRTVLEMDSKKENQLGMNPLKLNVGLHAEHFGWDVTWGPHVGLSRYQGNWDVQIQYHQGKIEGRNGRTARLSVKWFF